MELFLIRTISQEEYPSGPATSGAVRRYPASRTLCSQKRLERKETTFCQALSHAFQTDNTFRTEAHKGNGEYRLSGCPRLKPKNLETALIRRGPVWPHTVRLSPFVAFETFCSNMVASRLDRRLAARLDPSDIVQETLAEAAGRMDDYLGNPTLPFFGWLRLIAGEHIREAHRQHLFAQKRSITRESRVPEFTDESAVSLVRQLMAHDTSPSNRLVRQERCEQVKEAMATLSLQDRGVLAMKYVERLSIAEMAEALGMSEPGVKGRHMRAVVRLKALLEADA
jgi:RNA polymerase sigma-70 factor, ECF subfamily